MAYHLQRAERPSVWKVCIIAQNLHYIYSVLLQSFIMHLPEPWEEAHDRQGQIHYSKPMKSSEFTQEVVTTEVIIVTRGSEL